MEGLAFFQLQHSCMDFRYHIGSSFAKEVASGNVRIRTWDAISYVPHDLMEILDVTHIAIVISIANDSTVFQL